MQSKTLLPWFRTWNASALAFGLVVLMALMTTQTASAAPSCGNPSLWDPSQNITALQAGWGRLIQLRYNRANSCAWGKIVNAVGDETIWVDHSTTNKVGWEGPLSETWCRSRIPFGGCQISEWHTDSAYNDAGAHMRACVRIGDGRIMCTDWF